MIIYNSMHYLNMNTTNRMVKERIPICRDFNPLDCRLITRGPRPGSIWCVSTKPIRKVSILPHWYNWGRFVWANGFLLFSLNWENRVVRFMLSRNRYIRHPTLFYWLKVSNVIRFILNILHEIFCYWKPLWFSSPKCKLNRLSICQQRSLYPHSLQTLMQIYLNYDWSYMW